MDVEGIGIAGAAGEPDLRRRRGQIMHLDTVKPEGAGKLERSRRNVPNSDHVTGGIYSVSEDAVAASGPEGPFQVILGNQRRVGRIYTERVRRSGKLCII